MQRPVIGITTYAIDKDRRLTLPGDYVSAVRRAGGLPLLIPPAAELALDFLDRIDALVLAGGGDLDPTHYGGPRHDTVYDVDPERDAMEMAMIEAALRRRTPTLAICRGMQVLNVTRGGSLLTHLPDAVGDHVQHRAPPREPLPHAIRVDPGSRLAALLGTTELAQPMSWHHQGVHRLGAGLRAVAWADDGVIEGLELEGHPEMVAVQWHPELTAACDPVQQGLVDWLVRSAHGDTAC